MSEPILRPTTISPHQRGISPRVHQKSKTPPATRTRFHELQRKLSVPEDELWREEHEMDEESDHGRTPPLFVEEFEENQVMSPKDVKKKMKGKKRLSLENLSSMLEQGGDRKPLSFRPRMGSFKGKTVQFKPTVEYNYYTPRPSFSELDSDFIDNVNILDNSVDMSQLGINAPKPKKAKSKMFEPDDPDKELSPHERQERTNLYLEEVFQILDADMNNRLSLDELHKFCRHAYDEVSEEDVLHLSVQFGKEPMRGITFDEWVTVVKATDPDLHQFSDELYHLVVMTDAKTRKNTQSNETVPWRNVRQG